MSRVIVINEPRPCKYTGRKHFYDIAPASEYGQVEFLFNYNDFAPSSDPEEALIIAQDKLSAFHDDDFIVWAGGDSFGLLVAAIALANKPVVNYLKWDKLLNAEGRREGGQYLPITLELGE